MQLLTSGQPKTQFIKSGWAQAEDTGLDLGKGYRDEFEHGPRHEGTRVHS